MAEDEQAAGSRSPHIEEAERAQAAEHSALRPLVVHEIVREEGEAALCRSPGSLAWSGLAAGLSMGFSFLAQALLQAGLPDAPWRHLVAGLGYTVGFVIVILGRQQLFTESTLTAVLPVLTRRDAGTLAAAGRLWGIVLLANLAGTWIFALLLQPGGTFRPEAVEALRQLARAALPGDFGATVLKSVFAGWLIALMVWLLPSARSARLLTILVITYVVALARLSHVVAGSAEAAYAVLQGLAAPADYLTAFLLPTLIGNVVGGVALVALLNHGAIVDEIRPG
ncbi:MAG: formate/nitrite transporter family protein [Dongiaceae bacterium]